MAAENEQKVEWWRQKHWWIPGLLVMVSLLVLGLLILVVTVPPLLIHLPQPDTRGLSAIDGAKIQEQFQTDRTKAENDLRTALVTTLAGIVVAAGTFVAALNFTNSRAALEETQRQNRESSDLQRRGQVTERFGKAIDQLGEVGKLDVRIGAIYALEQLARDTREDKAGDLHWPIVEILTAFIREHTKADADSQPNSEHPLPPDKATASRTVAADIQAALTVLGQRDLDRDRGNVDLHEADLQGVILTRANLRGASLIAANLQDAILDSANLQDAIFIEANLQGAILRGANLQDAILDSANLQDAIFSGANLQGARLLAANLRGARVSGANLRGARLQAANLQEARLGGTDLQSADLRGADLQYAYLGEATVQDAILTEAHAQDVILAKAKGLDTILGEAMLPRKPRSANLQGARLEGANLQGARLVGTDLQDALLIGANFQDARLSEAKLQRARLSEANLQGAFLSWANLQGAFLNGANLQDARLDGTNLDRAVGLTQEQLELAICDEHTKAPAGLTVPVKQPGPSDAAPR